MTEHLALYQLASRPRTLLAEIEASKLPEYKKHNIRHQIKLMEVEIAFLLDRHDQKQCERCERLNGSM